jgi:hypothetical protein
MQPQAVHNRFRARQKVPVKRRNAHRLPGEQEPDRNRPLREHQHTSGHRISQVIFILFIYTFYLYFLFIFIFFI